jgi:hypothetical protein
VDHGSVFDETDVQSLLSEFQPDVHAGRFDRASRSPTEGKLAALGIRLAMVGGESTHSTSALIARAHRGMND